MTNKKIGDLTATTTPAATDKIEIETAAGLSRYSLISNLHKGLSDAAADGSTKGVATFTAADFNASSGVISIDYTNGQKATTAQAGLATELATAAETTAGSDEARVVTPDGLAGSNYGIRYISFHLNGSTALTTDDVCFQRIPAGMTGMNLVSVAASVGTGATGCSTSGNPTFTVTNATDSHAMLSTALTVDVNEYTSATAAAAAVIDTGEDDVVTDDLIKVAVTTAGTGTTYATVTLGFQMP